MNIKSISEKIQSKYSDIVTIIMIVQLIAALFQIWKACKKDDEINPDKLSVIDRAIFKRTVKKMLPGVSPKKRREIEGEILKELSNLEKDEIHVLIADAVSGNYSA